MRTIADESRIAISWLEEQGWVRYDNRTPVLSSAGKALLIEIRDLSVHQAARVLDERGARNPHFVLHAFLAVSMEPIRQSA